jgi:hypothetical protein
MPGSTEPSITLWVCPWRMRYQFNTMGFDDRVTTGELEIRIVSRAKPRAEFAELHGTESQIIQYRLRQTREV